MQVAFLGLGVMGYPMAGHLHQAGYPVTVYNRTETKAQKWVSEYGGPVADTARQAVKDADCIMLCVGKDQDVRQMISGPRGIASELKPGTIIVDHTTTSAHLAEEMSEYCLQHQVHYLDAPVSGGQSGAEQGKLTIMVGGEPYAFSRVEPVLSSYGKRVTHVGGPGSGQRCKMVNQICIAGILQGLSEGLTLAQKSGLDIPTIARVLGGGAAQSWQLDNRAVTMGQGEFDFGFAIELMHKDLSYCLSEGKKLGVELPITKLVDRYYQSLIEAGYGHCDTSVLIKNLG
ncbi:NAD(P)-dependent oxidoreductase [Dongshaea marina]|uniref:NAD(P)-dependent oxidoreductase n=1 Tax=Dongshaea marina TaxID=2047966 RepID=UPI000D3E1AB9|nr:NAD(P)-dependent oxidoreductase [Dongshaea marina]